MADIPSNVPVYALSENLAPTEGDYFVIQETGSTGDVKLTGIGRLLRTLAGKTDDGWCFNGNLDTSLDTTAAVGTTDGDLYAAITALGWESEVIV